MDFSYWNLLGVSEAFPKVMLRDVAVRSGGGRHQDSWTDRGWPLSQEEGKQGH